MVRVRLATVADAAGVLGVYAPYVEETPITFETSVPSEETFAARMRAVIGDYPYLVVEDAGRIVGFAYVALRAVWENATPMSGTWSSRYTLRRRTPDADGGAFCSGR